MLEVEDLASFVFREIEADDEQAEFICENGLAIAFLDQRPLFSCRVLVSALEHCEMLTDLPVTYLNTFSPTFNL